MSKRWYVFSVVLLLLTLAACTEVAAPSGESGVQRLSPGPTRDSSANEKFMGRVTRVVDGDTVDIAFSDGTQRIRLLGIDTPEISSRNEPNKYGNITDTVCLDDWGAKATETMATALEEMNVEVVLDPEAPVFDSFRRVLAYVYQDGDDASRTLPEAGLARVYTEGDSSRIADYLGVQEVAMAERRGLWACAGGTEAGDVSPSPGIGNCDPSYPGVCIPPPPPDLDCKQIPNRGFRVEGADPHRFDMDGNHIGCEG
ncbi:MAG: nuclease [SAR202 cluster bacterium]|nr:nuclease [SAR202 cluster bacterium]